MDTIIRPVLDRHKLCRIRDQDGSIICGQRAKFVVNKRANCRDHYENWKDLFVPLQPRTGEGVGMKIPARRS